VGLLVAWLVTQRSGRLEALRRELAERRRTEEALRDSRDELRRSREEFRALTEKTPVGIFRTDSAGDCTYVNEYWQRLCGIAPAETVGSGWVKAIHPDDVGHVAAVWHEALAERRGFSVAYRIRPADGGPIRHAITTAVAVNDERGDFSHYVGTVVDVTELERTARDLERRGSVLRNLIESQEREKRAICHDIHDGLLQYAVGSRMLLEGWQRDHADDAEADVIETVIGYLSRGIDEGRQVIRGVRPAVLDDLGLEAALGDLADQLRGAGMEIDVEIDADLTRLEPSLQTTIYRVVQESLSNVRKHSGSSRAGVTVRADDGRLRLVIRDTGRGFDPEAARQRGFGLPGMIERVRAAGGACDIESARGAGTTVTADLPFSTVPPPAEDFAETADEVAEPTGTIAEPAGKIATPALDQNPASAIHTAIARQITAVTTTHSGREPA
jgi:PAS domain S-box-containing protein